MHGQIDFKRGVGRRAVENQGGDIGPGKHSSSLLPRAAFVRRRMEKSHFEQFPEWRASLRSDFSAADVVLVGTAADSCQQPRKTLPPIGDHANAASQASKQPG